MSKEKVLYVCQVCGFASAKWLGCCTGCGQWHTMEEERREVKTPPSGRRPQPQPPVPLREIENLKEARISTGLAEMNRVLGGGLVSGGLVLVGGEPGIGKSTLLLQVLMGLAGRGHRVLYVSGEESAPQIRLRAERLGAIAPGLLVACETDMDAIEEIVRSESPEILAVDSIQTMSCPEIGSSPGTVTQIRESTGRLMQMAKTMAMPTVLVGHVTKEGAIAGPRVLEHLVDCVLYFEGDRSHAFRLLRTVKNRFGPTHEIGVFEMREEGLAEVGNPSALFVGERPRPVPGSVVMPCIEGTRPILVELQALVSPTPLSMPRRTTMGIDASRLALLIAVAERHLGLVFYDRDVFVNVLGGMKIAEPAVDLAVIVAMVSSFQETPVPLETAVFGEVGLTGEVRAVGKAEQRLHEAARLGFRRCVLPRPGSDRLRVPPGLEVLTVQRIEDAVAAVSKFP